MEYLDHLAGSIYAPNSSLSIQQLTINQAGAALDGSQDEVLGSLTATAASGSPTVLTLQAADGTTGGRHRMHYIGRLYTCMFTTAGPLS